MLIRPTHIYEIPALVSLRF